MNIAQDFENARRFLGWSFQDVSEKLAGRYSSEYLKKVHRGEPFAEVNYALKRLYVGALAEKAVDSVLKGSPHPYHVRVALIDGFVDEFVRFVRRKDLSLGDAKTLSDSIKAFRVILEDASAIDEIRWEKELEAIIRERDKPEQGMLIEGVDEIAYGSTHSSSHESDLSMPSYQPKRDPQSVLAVCNFCREPLPENRVSKHACGHPNDDYL